MFLSTVNGMMVKLESYLLDSLHFMTISRISKNYFPLDVYEQASIYEKGSKNFLTPSS